MPVAIQKCPADVVAACLSGLGQYLPPGSPLLPALYPDTGLSDAAVTVDGEAGPQATDPVPANITQPVYMISLKDLLASTAVTDVTKGAAELLANFGHPSLGLADIARSVTDLPQTLQHAAKLTGWRVLATVDGKHVACYAKQGEGRPKMVSVQHGSRLDPLASAARAVEDILMDSCSDSRSVTYSMRVLHLPCIYIEAFWIVPVNPGPQSKELIFPYLAQLPSIPKNRAMGVREFLSACASELARLSKLPPNLVTSYSK